VAGASVAERIPQYPFPEVAFWGRSNVGKSSLLNALIGSGIARTSNTPGRTQQLNFFNLGDKLILVDMPGYGFANVPLKMKHQWEQLISTYLTMRDKLKRVFVLIDARHGFKIPLPSHATLKTELEEILQKHPAARPEVLMTSAERKAGIFELQLEVAGL
jgi:GTP-binding protein